MSSDALSGRGVPRGDLALGRLANQLINTTLCESRSDRHVVATERVAQGPGVHEPVTDRVTTAISFCASRSSRMSCF